MVAMGGTGPRYLAYPPERTAIMMMQLNEHTVATPRQGPAARRLGGNATGGLPFAAGRRALFPWFRRREGARSSVKPPQRSLAAYREVHRKVDRSGRLHWRWSAVRTSGGTWRTSAAGMEVNSLTDAVHAGCTTSDAMWAASATGKSVLRHARFSEWRCLQRGVDVRGVHGLARDFDAWQWVDGHPTRPPRWEQLTVASRRKRQVTLDTQRGAVAAPAVGQRSRDARRGRRGMCAYAGDPNVDDTLGRVWCTYTPSAWARRLWLQSTYFAGTCHPPSHPKVRMWNVFVQVTQELPMATRGVLPRGRQLWALRQRVATGVVARPLLTWAAQPSVLSYDTTHVVYAMVPKRGDNRLYVGISAMGAWARFQSRINGTFYADGRAKVDRATRQIARHLDASLARRGLVAALHDYYIVVLEHVPPVSAAEQTDATLWRVRAHRYERFWIHYLDAAAEGGGYNIEHTSAAKTGTRSRRYIRRSGAGARGFGQVRVVAHQNRGRGRPMKYHRARRAAAELGGPPPSVPPSPPQSIVSPPCPPSRSPTPVQSSRGSRRNAEGVRRRTGRRRARREAVERLAIALRAQSQGCLAQWAANTTRVVMRLIMEKLLSDQEYLYLDERAWWRGTACGQLLVFLREALARRAAPASKRASRALIVAAYGGQAVENLNLAEIVADQSISSLVPGPTWRQVGAPMVVYKYFEAAITRIGNWSIAARSASSTPTTCRCAESRFAPFRHPVSGHVVTKDLSIVDHPGLRSVLERGPTLRMRPCRLRPLPEGQAKAAVSDSSLSAPAKLILSMVDQALDKFVEEQEDVHGVPRYVFAAWAAAIWQRARQKLVEGAMSPQDAEEIIRWFNADDDEPGWPAGSLLALQAMHRQYVFTVADKETGTFTICCRQHWVATVQKDLDTSGTYVAVGGGADAALAERRACKQGAEGFVPLPPPPPPPLPLAGLVVPGREGLPIPALEATETDRVLRAWSMYGVLSIPVVGMQPTARIQRALHDTLAELATERAQVEAGRWRSACERARAAARRLHLDQRAVLVSERARLRSVEYCVTCPVDLSAMQQFAQSAEAQLLAVDREGKPYGAGHRWHGCTRGAVVREFMAKVTVVPPDARGPRGQVNIQYRMPAKGAQLRAAGYVMLCRVNAGGADPFTLPTALREMALARFGTDFDDSSSYPRGFLHMLESGAEVCRLFIENREAVLRQAGAYFFPTASATERRDRVKLLTNRLDMDGTFDRWCDDMEVPQRRRHLPSVRVELPPTRTSVAVRGARVHVTVVVQPQRFNMAAYVAAQPARTREVGRRCPRMLAFVQELRPQRRGDHPDAPLRTIKSYIAQEREAVSREAKRAWCVAHGHHWLNTQHDGMIIALRRGISLEVARLDLKRVCSAWLGYPQPVEVKHMAYGGGVPLPAPEPHRPVVVQPSQGSALPDSAYIRALRTHFAYLHRRGMVRQEHRAVQQGSHTAGCRHQMRAGTLSTDQLEQSFVRRFSLSYMYATVKTHKDPYGWRFIAGGSTVSLTALCEWIHRALQGLREDAAALHRASVCGMWSEDPVPCESSYVVDDSRDVVMRVRDLEARFRRQTDLWRQGRAQRPLPRARRKFSVMDFTTLYPSLPHGHIREALQWIVHAAFARHAGQLLAVYDSGTWAWVTPTAGPRGHRDTSVIKYYSAALLLQDVDFVLDNTFVSFGDSVYRQVMGVPMGFACSPNIAVLMLCSYEIRALQRARAEAESPMGTLVETPRGWQCLTPSLRVRLFRLACRASRCCRAIDDVLFLDLSIQERDFVVRRMYPPELELKEVCRSPQPIFYLDMAIRRDRGGFYTTMYDKRDELARQGLMGKVLKFPHITSVLSNRCKYGVLTGFVHRAFRVEMRVRLFVQTVVKRVLHMVEAGYRVAMLLCYVRRFMRARYWPRHAWAAVYERIRRAVEHANPVETVILTARPVETVTQAVAPSSPSRGPPRAVASPVTGTRGAVRAGSVLSRTISASLALPRPLDRPRSGMPQPGVARALSGWALTMAEAAEDSEARSETSAPWDEDMVAFDATEVGLPEMSPVRLPPSLSPVDLTLDSDEEMVAQEEEEQEEWDADGGGGSEDEDAALRVSYSEAEVAAAEGVVIPLLTAALPGGHITELPRAHLEDLLLEHGWYMFRGQRICASWALATRIAIECDIAILGVEGDALHVL